MDVAAYLQRFESCMSSFVGDDPLEQWEKFVELVLRKLPPDSSSQLSPVLNRLVETFLNVEKYSNDERFVNYCIKCASFYADPLALYSHLFSKGVGTHSAVFYVSWAQHLEQKDMNDQAEAVYQKGIENQAQPAISLLSEYRQFQSRTKPPVASSGVRNPLQNSNSANIMTTRGEASSQNKESVDCQPSKSEERRYVVMVSRSEYSGKLPPSSTENQVAAYDKEALQCEESELCFEEVRAQRYFQKIQEQQKQQQEAKERQETTVFDEDVTQANMNLFMNIKMKLEALDENSTLEADLQPVPDRHQPVVPPRASVWPNTRTTLGLRLHSEPTSISGTQMSFVPEPLINSRASAALQSQNATVLRASFSQHAAVSDPDMSHNAPDRALNELLHTPLFSASMSHHTPAPVPSISPCALVPTASKVPDTPVSGASLSFQASLTDTSMSHHAPLSDTSMPHHALAPASSMSHYEPVLTASMSHQAPHSTGSMSHHTLVPTSSVAHNASVSISSMSHQASLPDTSMSHHALAPAASMSRQSTVPSASMVPDAPNSAASMSCQASLPDTSMSHHAPLSETSLSHHALAPAASMSHHESVFRQGLASGDCRTESEHKDVEDPLEPEHEADVSQGGTANLSRITPNNSLGYIQATPSRVLPSPTVNTREALDVIMDMFQAPTFLEEPFPSALEEHDIIYTRNGPTVKPAAATPFTIFQDEAESEDKENLSAPSAVGDKVKPIRALAELPKLTKPNDTPPELAPDESTMWGAQFHAQHSLAACPNSTSDFAMLAQMVSTPFTHKTPMSTTNTFFPEQENGDGEEEDGFARRYTKKLSPIMEQSPSEEKPNDTVVTRQSLGSRQGTIVGEALAMNTQLMTTSCTTMVQPPPPAVLSFRDQTLGPNNTSVHRSAGPGWEVYTSPQPSPKREPFTVMEDVEEQEPVPDTKPPQDIPMSPDTAPRPEWLAIQSPEKSAERDLDAFLSPQCPETSHMSHLSQDIPMSPQVEFSTDAHMMSPDRDLRAPLDVSMNPKTPRRSRAMSLVPDPWNDDLIAHFLASMDPPLMAHPHCVSWHCNLPDIAPKMTLSMGSASLRVDSVLGEGAFAKVFQATDPMTSEKMVLKVQKPANPWEFYINTQLDARVPPSIRHFYSSFNSAHLFNNGSVLLGEMHNYGTLLNAVNMYRTLGDKVMPQPLVMYFTVCILHMIEQLHSVGIVHADVKPDNFLLGERFLQNTGFDRDNLDHGLVLIDLGQSIDMRLFPEGTAFTAKCLTSGFQCTEMQTGKPWNYQTDYFGVAGTVYCMLFGTYMQVVNDGGVWRTNGVFRRNPHSDLWQEFFYTLLNVPDCSSLPDLSGLRHKLLSVLEQTYRTKLPSLKSRLVVLLLESSRKALRR